MLPCAWRHCEVQRQVWKSYGSNKKSRRLAYVLGGGGGGGGALQKSKASLRIKCPEQLVESSLPSLLYPDMEQDAGDKAACVV